jgi:acyl dehydratase
MIALSEVRAGQELRPLVIESVDAEKMKTMAAILQDPNPIHFDVDTVRELGLGDRPVNQGPINMSYLINLVSGWTGDPAALRRFSVRFLGNVLAGERLECTGRVTSVDEEAGTAELELHAAVGERPVLSGSATVALRA